MFNKRLSSFVCFIGLLLFVSCKSEEVTKDVQRYCECLSEKKHSLEEREICFEMMYEIKDKWKHSNRRMLQILDETENCL